MTKLTVAGGGVLGSQIAYQSAIMGYDVTIWLRSEGSIERAKPKLERLHGIYLAELEAAKDKCGNPEAMVPRGLIPDIANTTVEDIDDLIRRADEAYENLDLNTDLEESVKDADILIECMAEIKDAKIDFYKKIAGLLPEKTVIYTNSSTMIPSDFAEYTGRPEKYLATHFANNVWQLNTVEIMGHAGTDPEVYEGAVKYAESINMVPLKVLKETPQYMLNNMLTPLMYAAIELYANGVGEVETLDTTWKIATGAPMGPFEIVDMIGVTTLYNATKGMPEGIYTQRQIDAVLKVLQDYLDAGKLGIASGEGFYKYE